ncbi:hypothetical protein B0T17DRAFT_603391 [Bombardia bombarda]|uniref:Uncharacterized protein n=1 Tax=Bombardia bombarda TaxID=252184 RepID=A0AA39TR33_9PEZI|nr:hypothetical protein B0T17DRAFT_603391 [Bombardia bombarda]
MSVHVVAKTPRRHYFRWRGWGASSKTTETEQLQWSSNVTGKGPLTPLSWVGLRGAQRPEFMIYSSRTRKQVTCVNKTSPEHVHAKQGRREQKSLVGALGSPSTRGTDTRYREFDIHLPIRHLRFGKDPQIAHMLAMAAPWLSGEARHQNNSVASSRPFSDLRFAHASSVRHISWLSRIAVGGLNTHNFSFLGCMARCHSHPPDPWRG